MLNSHEWRGVSLQCVCCVALIKLFTSQPAFLLLHSSHPFNPPNIASPSSIVLDLSYQSIKNASAALIKPLELFISIPGNPFITNVFQDHDDDPQPHQICGRCGWSFFIGARYSASSTSAGPLTDRDSRPSTARSSLDMCTPMPNRTFSHFDSKCYSTASESSFTSAPYLSTASEAESSDSLAPKSHQPSTPPIFSAQSSLRDVTLNKQLDKAGLHAPLHSWQSVDRFDPSEHHTAEPDSFYQCPAEQVPSYNAFSAWHSQPATQQPPSDYARLAGAFNDGTAGHSRSASYQSTVSSDSWNSRAPVESDFALSAHPSALAASMAQISLNPFPNASMPGMGAYPSASDMKNDVLAVPHPAGFATTRAHSAQDTRNMASPFAALAGAFQPAPTAYGAHPFMDPHTFMAYTAAFGASPLLDLYGITPELLAARSNALAQLANSVDKNHPAASQKGCEDGSASHKKTNLYKTELCRSWEEKGTCRYGSKCQFAHGQEELKNVSRHPKFKTEICRTFWLHGSCPYGKRCCFLHTTPTQSGVSAAPSSLDKKEATQAGRNVHDPPISRLQQRLSSSTPLDNATGDKTFNVSLSGHLSTSPQLHSAPAPRALSDVGSASHSRCTSTSSCSLSSEGSSRGDSLRIQIGSRFGAREQVPPQDAPAPRSRLERLRPTGDYADGVNSMPSTSTATSTRYSPFLDRPQPPHSAFSDILARAPSQHISKARSANGERDSQWPSSRLSASSTTLV
ncbi:uncharacterized protein VP01_1484g1 [Puccinia sorghi]|uniref:C3H1-type domain-containing protein n=1 Tax=Puccinia sorghi TaxID=27349 RepID=A0A0L6VK32_9BASI|nr:uncharacterized protein VP01_1484g1 [Puccinia sorghi]